MATFFVENFGCRATDADAAAIRRELIAAGFENADDGAHADVVVLNTCTVTAAADSQSREAIRRLHRANPAARVIVTGCYAQRAPEELASLDGVSFVIGNSHQAQIPGAVRELLHGGSQAQPSSVDFVSLSDIDGEAMSLARGPAKILTGDIFDQTALQIVPGGLVEGDRTRPILKIQDGCNNRCSYCVIPLVRGRSRSLAPGEVVAQVRNLVEAGAKEIVLSGINLGAYGRDLAPRVDLAHVVRRILNETELEQLRFSSIEPQDVTEDFVTLAASSQRIAPHFHIPLQSGSDRILRAMHRWYRTEHYAERSRIIRRHLPDAAIGADVIVGFPGESEADFQATADFIERLPFTYLHVFSFSERPGTVAEKLGERIKAPVIRERARHLRAVSDKKNAEFRASQSGRATRALTLARTGDIWTEALTGNYLKIRVGGRYASNQWVEVVLPRERETLAELSPAVYS
jgi:threonylcarbamoyladenosine tRNA methylthiotransferase MtaB